VRVERADRSGFAGGRATRRWTFAPAYSFTEDQFSPLLTDLHDRLGGQRVILVWDRLSARVAARIRTRTQPGRTMPDVAKNGRRLTTLRRTSPT
jgi:hypothetical protein